MNIAIISGSSRAGSQSLKVAQVMQHKLSTDDVSADIIDLHKVNLPVYDDQEHQQWEDLAPILKDADGFVLIVPEWNGSAGPAVPNFLTYASVGVKPLAHKPVLLVGVSSGTGGAYPIAQIKMFGNKNNFAIHLPDQLRFMNVEEVFNANEPDQDSKADAYLHKRTDYALNVLREYAEKLKDIRATGVINLKDYSNGN